MTEITQQSLHYRMISAGLAFLLWGGWAFFVNDANGLQGRLTAGSIQGCASFVITLFMLRLLGFFTRSIGAGFSKLAPSVATVTVTGSGLFLIHWIAATPDIILTITPALAVAFGFCLYTASRRIKPPQPEELNS